jgi:aminoglycoside phosphotransferase (APT) family kinase protein
MRTPESFFPAARFGAIRSVTPVSVGLSGAGVYAVATESGEFFLRLNTPDAAFARMLAAYRAAAAQGIAPGIVFVNEALGVTITEKANGVAIGTALARPDIRPAVLHGVAQTLARLHAIPAPDLPRTDSGLARSVWSTQTIRDGFPAWAKPFGTRLDVAEAALAKDQRRVFSHNDVNPVNLIWDDARVWMVDWDHASLAHPYSDLAIFAMFAMLPDEDAVALLAVQEGAAITSEQRATFLALRDMIRMIYGAVFFRLIPDLTAVAFTDRATTPTLAECYGMMAGGTLDLRTPAGQALLGAAILRQVEWG